MRRFFLLALIATPLAGALAMYGCGSDEPPLEDFCSWLGDTNNCFRNYAKDVEPTTEQLARCANLSLAPVADPTQPQLGEFQSRDKLDKCFLAAGGLVEFDKPVDLTMLPPTEVSFKLTNANETECGTVDWKNTANWSITINGDKAADGGFLPDSDSVVEGGTLSYILTPGGRDTVTASCPDGEAHYFDTLEVSKCQQYSGLVPTATVEVITGGLDENGNLPTTGAGTFGAIKFTVSYPPTDAQLASQNLTAVSGEPLANAAAVPIQYFTCVIPPPPPDCADGVQDDLETDIDCGGKDQCARCADGGACIVDSDCVSGSCIAGQGIKKCVPTANETTTGATTADTTGASTSTATGTSTSTGG